MWKPMKMFFKTTKSVCHLLSMEQLQVIHLDAVIDYVICSFGGLFVHMTRGIVC